LSDGILNTVFKWIADHLSLRYLIVAAIITGFMIFGPPTLLASLGLDAIVAKYRGIISLIFLSNMLLAITYPIESVYDGWAAKRKVRKCLLCLTNAEGNLLIRRCLLDERRATQVIGDIGPARSLEKKGILWESCERGMGHGFNITPLAYAVLKEAQFVARFTPERSG
jgi:hypothetical protein